MALTRDDAFWSAFSGHAQRTTRAAGLLVQILEHPDQARVLGQQIADLEHEGDRITHETVLALHQTWITPLDREDIHGLISRLDDVLDLVDSASDRFTLYQLASVRSEAIEIAKILHVACAEIERAMGLLRNMKDGKQLLDLCRQINRHEHDADTIFRRALARLFNERTDPLEVMKWRDILDALEAATDRAEDVANIIEGIVLEHA